MKNNKFLALLRGINVGGNNVIKMEHLKTSFVDIGFDSVLTYIQSGNVIFESDLDNLNEITEIIEKKLSDVFSYQSKIVLLHSNKLNDVIMKSPVGFGLSNDEFKYDVMFLKEPLTAEQVIESLKLREGVDKVYAGLNVVYFSRLISKSGQSYLNKLITQPIYKQMTIRNWNTTTKLYNLMFNT
jgi:uncharacterized protein (DUF1697 family)